MVTATIFSSAGTKIIDIGDVEGQPWLEETTYLIDSAGKTTATIAQTERPTSQTGTGPFSTPFVTGPPDTNTPDIATGRISIMSETRQSFPLQGATPPSSSSSLSLSRTIALDGSIITTPPSPLASSIPPSSLSASNAVTGTGPEPSTPPLASTKPPVLNIAMGLISGVFIALVLGVMYYFYRRRRRGRAYSRNEGGSSGRRWTDSVPSSPLRYGMVESRPATAAVLKAKAILGGKFRNDKDDGWSQRWPQEKPDDDLDKHISHDDYASKPPPPAASGIRLPSPAIAPASILKETPIDPKTTLLFTAQSLLQEVPTYEPTFAEKKPQAEKKGVKWGPDQIREFGWTPVASREPSVDGRFEKADDGPGSTRRRSRSRSGRRKDHEGEGEAFKKANRERPR